MPIFFLIQNCMDIKWDYQERNSKQTKEVVVHALKLKFLTKKYLDSETTPGLWNWLDKILQEKNPSRAMGHR